jgi:ribosomal protein S1
MNDVAAWEKLKQSLPIGSIVSGVATRHAPFGVFVTITGVPFDGLIQITDFKDTGRMTPDEFPAIGSNLGAVVLGFKETGRQIWLGIRPSQIEKAEKATL